MPAGSSFLCILWSQFFLELHVHIKGPGFVCIRSFVESKMGFHSSAHSRDPLRFLRLCEEEREGEHQMAHRWGKLAVSPVSSACLPCWSLLLI